MRWVITLVRGEGDKVGLEVATHDKGESLMVTKVKEGMVAKWNQEHPEKAVFEGDFIIESNGVNDSATGMLNRIVLDKVAELTIERTPEQEARLAEEGQHAEDAPHAEAPNDRTPEEEARHAERARILVKKYSLLVLKVGAGGVRLFLEDALNFFVQGAFLVKYWDKFSISMRAFTMTSMAAGLLCSCVGPIKDTIGSCRLSAQAAAAGVSVTLKVSGHTTGEGQQVQPLLEEESISPPATHAQKPDMPEAQKPDMPAATKGARILYEGSILDFITEGRARHSVAAHRLLIINALTYWGSMGLMPVLFWSSIKGGIQTVVPVSAVLFFVLVTMFSIVAELWIAAHSTRGYDLVVDCGENIWKAVGGKGSKEAVAFGTILLSLIGRWDTFCDVAFTIILWKTPEITFLNFEHTLHVKMNLPLPLHHVALFSVVVGVFCLQGIPGIVLTCTKTALPAAFKFNEFNLLLGIMEYETNEVFDL